MKPLPKALIYLHRLEDGALIFALLVMLGTAVGQILLRNLFDTGLMWSETFLRVLVLWVAMLGAMVATREGKHICIDLLPSALSGALQAWCRALSALFAAALCFVLAYQSLTLVGYEWEDGTLAFARVPVWVCQAILPFGFAVMGVRFVLAPFGLRRQSR